MCPSGELEERCGKVGGVKKLFEKSRSEKREARSEKREARSKVTILLKREARSEKRGVLNNAPEIEVGAVV